MGKLSSEQVENLRMMYQAGMSASDVATKLGVTSEAVYYRLKSLGIIERHYKLWSEKERNGISLAYTSGLSTTQVAKLFNTDPKNVYGLLIKSGTPIRTKSQSLRKYDLDETVFDKLTQEAAYWIGFLMADGGVWLDEDGCYRINLKLQERDRAHVEKWAKFIGTSKPIRTVVSKPRPHDIVQGHFPSAWLSINSAKIALRLAEYGVVPRKTWTAEAKGGVETNRHFWRGVIDGDGHIGKGQYPHVLLTGTKMLCDQFAEFCKVFTGKNMYMRAKSKLTWDAQINGKNARTIMKTLYSNCHIALDRKLALASRFIGD